MSFNIKAVDDIAEIMGSAARISFERFGALVIFFYNSIAARWRYLSILSEMYTLGVKSLPLVIFLSAFTGFISILFFNGITGGLALNYMGTAMVRAVLVEFGPTFTGLILAGRIGTKVASEVGSMRVTEQIDAMSCLAMDPMSYIVNSRIIACLIMGPVIFVLGSVTAIVSAQFFATLALGIPASTYYSSMRLLFSLDPLVLGLVKSIVFTGLIGLSGCFFGYNTTGGAVGVGQSTRDAVTTSSILILIANFVVTKIFT